VSLDLVEHGGMIQMRPDNALERGMYLRQQPADKIAGLSDWATKSSSKPHNIVSSATSLSASFSERSIAAWCMRLPR
jgi:hypothetical protein